ncbi:MAG: hypothetical protein R3C53_08840 [Pirellulaceae bacterium]
MFVLDSRNFLRFRVPLACLLLLSVNSFARADQPAWAGMPIGSDVAVSLASGRVMRGKLDARSTQEQLWLTLEDQGIQVSSIVSAEYVALVQPASAVSSQAVDTARGPARAAAAVSNIAYQRGSRSGSAATSLSAFAHIDNWDADPQADGIRLYLRPRTADGKLVQVAGFVSVELEVYRGDVRDISKHYRVEESWSYELTKSDFDQHGAMVQLPFRSIQPENDREIFELGTLHVRFKIAGQGVLDTTLNDVVLRNRSYSEELRRR